jgi:hypothetical protein
MTIVLRALAAVVALAGLAVSAAAQTAAPSAPPPQPTPDMRPAEIQRLFDAYLVMEAQQTLGLSEAQYPAFLTRLRALQETRRRTVIARQQILGDLARMTAPRAPEPPSDAVLRERLAALQELEARGAAESRKAYADLDALLEPRQQARFRVFEDQIERRKIELMLRARQNARQPGLRPLRR